MAGLEQPCRLSAKESSYLFTSWLFIVLIIGIYHIFPKIWKAFGPRVDVSMAGGEPIELDPNMYQIEVRRRGFWDINHISSIYIFKINHLPCVGPEHL